ncbi:hypothetical protein GCM10012289_77760 [Nonomuraea cavernae]|uniref:Uncharacterized protein n=1 Tax=Nonomuraea cavernae TaxID=2045107 RepID=A0A918DV53_9ACTN|nr:hypothetical protein GCM10012289_77760 [Nonomuraea cavernae]
MEPEQADRHTAKIADQDQKATYLYVIKAGRFKRPAVCRRSLAALRLFGRSRPAAPASLGTSAHQVCESLTSATFTVDQIFNIDKWRLTQGVTKLSAS